MSEGAVLLGSLAVGFLFGAAYGNKNKEQQKKLEKNKNGEQPPAELTHEQIEAQKVADLLNSNHHVEAVSKACKMLFGLVRRKSDITDKDATGLIDHVFSPKKPILKFTRHEKYPHVKSHEGYYFILKGISLAFRNTAMHENIEMLPNEAMTQIATIAYMYELIDNHTKLMKSGDDNA